MNTQEQKPLPYPPKSARLHWTKYQKNYEHFILSTIDVEELDERGLSDTDSDRLRYITERFQTETGGGGGIPAIEEWLSGLALDIPFTNYEIIELAHACGSCRCGLTERQEEKIVANYFNFMANVIYRMFAKS